MTQAREVLRLTDPRSRSVGESRAQLLLHSIGFEPKPQVEIRDHQSRVIGRVDFLLERNRIIGEFDGLMSADANGHAALAAEKQREDRLRTLGYEFVRLTWADLSRPAPVERVMRQARVRASARRAS